MNVSHLLEVLAKSSVVRTLPMCFCCIAAMLAGAWFFSGGAREKGFASRIVGRHGLLLQIGAMLPFFTDFMSLIGAIGFTPMDFVLPQFLWIKAYKPKGPA
jgi:hypothetical protein